MKTILIVIIVVLFGAFNNPVFSYSEINNQSGRDEIMVKEQTYQKIGFADGYTVYKKAGDFFFAQALETIYEDRVNRYYFTEMRSGIYLLVNEDEKIGVKEALKEGKVSIDSLMRVIPEIKVDVKSQ